MQTRPPSTKDPRMCLLLLPPSRPSLHRSRCARTINLAAMLVAMLSYLSLVVSLVLFVLRLGASSSVETQLCSLTLLQVLIIFTARSFVAHFVLIGPFGMYAHTHARTAPLVTSIRLASLRHSNKSLVRVWSFLNDV